MKKIKLLLLLLIALFMTSACSISSSKLDNANIYTTIYPVQYITKYLYGENSTISSIYPVGVDLNKYNLTSKQIDNYSKGDLFVYIGLGNEKNVAKSLLNNNKKLLLIDATHGLNYNNELTELWLAPNNFLMLAKNIKNSLNEYLDNKIKQDRVNTLYDDLYVKVSWIDAELRNIGREAQENGKNTIVVSSNVFKFLEGYGFDVISLEDILNSDSENAISDIKTKFKNSKYTEIIKLSSEENNQLMTELITKYKAKMYDINDLVTNSDSASDYISIQYENISVIRDITK